MAQDPDQVKVAGLYETRGRQSKSHKARTLESRMKAFEATARGLTRSLDFALPLGLFAFTSWSTRLRVTAIAGTVTVGLYSADRTVLLTIRPTYKGRPVSELHFGFPELYAAEGAGMLTILMSMPGSDIIGLVENGLALAIYHVLLNGGGVNIPGTTAGATSLLDPLLWGAFPVLGLFLLLTSPSSSATRLNVLGLFPSVKWTLTEMQVNLQRAVDQGRLVLPTGDHVDVPLDALVRRIQLDSTIKSLAHGAFLTLLLKRGGGVVPTE